MKFKFINNFNRGVNLDLDALRLPPDAAIFIKNLTNNININQGTPGASGSNKFIYSPLEGNQALSISAIPSGSNYCVGFYSSEQTNEGYFLLYNSNNNHSIWVISGDNGSVIKVHQSSLLSFILDPQFFLSEGRITFMQKSVMDPETLGESNFKFLIFTSNIAQQCFIDVSASIATDSYSTPYFTDSSAFYNPLELIHLGAPTPLKCVGIQEYTPVPSDSNKQNLLINAGWQFRIRTWDVWGRVSDWGIVSSVYSVIIGGGCITTSNGLRRCVNLVFDAGNPLVKFITVAFRRGVGNSPNGETETIWYEYETFRKYDDTSGVQWYNRVINPIFSDPDSGISFDDTTNLITYAFCADKGSIPVDTTEASLTEPGLPRFSSTVFSIEQNIGLANNVYSFPPVDPDIVDQIHFSVKIPDEVPCPAAPVRSITVFACLYNPVSESLPLLRRTFDVYTFGDGNSSVPPTDTSNLTTNFKVGQVFGDQTNPGFIAYLAGTPYKVIGEWGDYDPSTGIFTPNPLPWPGPPDHSFPHIKVTRFTFVGVPAGKYVVRLASHHATINDNDLQKTSTQVAGLAAMSTASILVPTISGSIFEAYCSNPTKEIEVDCSLGDVNLGLASSNMFVILDLNDGAHSSGLDGYLYEQLGAAPVEMAPCIFFGDILGTIADGIGSFYTDHNGYFFSGSVVKARVLIYVDVCDGHGLELVFNQISGLSNNAKMVHGNGDGTRNPNYFGNSGSWNNQVYVARPDRYLTSFPDGGRRFVRQYIFSCADSSIGFPGIPIVMTKCQADSTDSSGLAFFISHNQYIYSDIETESGITVFGSSFVPNPFLTPNYLVYSQLGGCEWTVCETCETYRSDTEIAYLDCGDPPSGCVITGIIATQRIDAGGAGYANGNSFDISGGTSTATGQVISNSAGVVTSILITDPGEGYSAGVTYSTVATSGSGVGLQIGVLATYPPPRTLCLDSIQLNPNGIGISGLQSGGKYGPAFWLHDVIGRHTAPQVRQGNLGYVFTPNLNDAYPPFPAMALCSLQVNIPSAIFVDPVFTRISFLVSPNVLFYDFFSWAADWVQLIDNTGRTNTANPTAIRIYFPSLNEYNKQFNFQTNIGWDFIAQSIGQTMPNDVVQFIMNGNGVYVLSTKSASITYDRSGSFFTIAYQSELAGLQNGCLFRIIRPRQNTTATNLPYYEQCLTLNIVDGLLPAGTYTIPYVDSYLISRAIPVPLLKGQVGPVVPGGIATGIQYTSSNQNTTLETDGYSTNNINNANGVVIFQLTDSSTTFPFFFESPSRSDLWGSHSGSPGRVGIPNPYEQQYRVGTEIALSDPLLNKGFINGLSRFTSTNKQIFARNTWGDITVVLVETSILLVICNSDHFLLRYSGSNVFVDPATGNVLSRNAQGIFQAPERKSGTNYGCVPYNINTIRRYAGTVRWLDTSGFLVLHNFSTADSNTDEAGYLGYLLQKLAEVNFQNLNGREPKPIIYFLGGIDVKNSEYYLTVFRIPGLSSPPTAPLYINPYSEPKPAENETLVFDLKTLILKGFASFTPEYYGLMPKFYSQRQFISFKGGRPYTHHNNFLNPSIAPPKYATFYGVQCECRITAVCNVGPEKVKRYFYVELYTDASFEQANLPTTAIWYSDSILTEKGQTSRLLVPRWTLRNNFQCAAFICASNTPVDSNMPVQTGVHAILDGNQLQGRWLQISFVTRDEYAGTYYEVTSLIIHGDGVDKSG